MSTPAEHPAELDAEQNRKNRLDLWGTIFGFAGFVVGVLGIVFGYLIAPVNERLQALRLILPFAFGAVVVLSVVGVAFLIQKRIRRADERALRAEAKAKQFELECQAIREATERECKAFQEGARQTHSVHHLLRDAFDRLDKQPRPLRADTLLELQRGTVADACRLISILFLKLAGCEVHVCVSLCRQIGGPKPKIVAFAWAYSEPDYGRVENSVEYAVDETNTRLYLATRKNHEGLTYFFSPDLEVLEKEGKYRDQTPNWKERYLSCLIIPIRLPSPDDEPDRILGLLKIETLAKNKLNGTYHRDLAAAFADAICLYIDAGRLLNPSDSTMFSPLKETMAQEAKV